MPTVAIVGRPNVGKSTLFNRLTRSRKALTHDLPGVTRDRVAGDARRPGGGTVVVVDTGGFEPESGETIPVLIRHQALRAVEDADAVVLVVDGAQGVVSADEEIAAVLRRAGRPVVLAVNKEDRRDAAAGEADFARLGIPAVALSAEHGRGIDALWEALEPYLPPPEEAVPPSVELAVAIVGRPNVGKSSLLNRLLGEERVLVSEVPGTTRDAVDTLLEWRGRHVRLVDTAGIRRRGRTDRGPEVLSVVMARKAIERAQVCLVVLDGGDGVTAQDTHVAGLVTEAGRGAVVVVNKSDLLPAGAGARREVAERIRERLKFLHDTPLVFVSALTGAGVSKVLAHALEVGAGYTRRVTTGELNRVLRAAWERHPPPGGKRPVRLYYATQTGSAPPRFSLFTSATAELHFSYLRYLENVVREAFPFEGVPVTFIMRRRGSRSR
jgi:GTP-binding protein